MARNTKTAVATRNAGIDAKMARCNNGKVRIYTAPQPADSDTAISTQTLLAELSYGATAYGAAAAGAALANAITADPIADATGTAAWARHVTSGGAAVYDSSVGGTAQGENASTVDILLNTAAIVAGAQVGVSSMTYSEPA